VRAVLDAHFPLCNDGTDVFQGDGQTPGRCGCKGYQHSYSLAELGAVLYTFHPGVHTELCGSIGSPVYNELGRCVQEITGTPLTLGQRKVNSKTVRNHVLGVRRPPREAHAAQAHDALTAVLPCAEIAQPRCNHMRRVDAMRGSAGSEAAPNRVDQGDWPHICRVARGCKCRRIESLNRV